MAIAHLFAKAASSLGSGFRPAALAAAAVGLASCLVSPPAESPHALRGVIAPTRPSPRQHVVVVVALDGVRWQDVFEGVDPKLARQKNLAAHEVLRPEQLMPNVHDIVVTRGAALGAPGHGEPIRASGPDFVSLPGYMEMLSGTREPACRSNQCQALIEPTLADDFADESDGWASDVAVVASWPELVHAAARRPERIALSAGRHGGLTRHLFRYDPESAWLLEAAEHERPFPGHGDFRPDRFTAAIALRYLRTQTPRFLFLSLGEPDAYAHRGLYRQYLGALRHADAVVGEIEQHLDELRARGHRATLFVTTDHGRGRRFAGHGAMAPESSRVWLVAAGSGVRARGWVSSHGERRLADLAPTVRSIVGIRQHERPGAGTVLDELLAPDPG